MKILINNISELNRLVLSLKEGESLVINEHGVISKGKIKGSLTELSVKTVGKKSNDFDSNGMQEFINTKWYVESQGKAFKNMWDYMRVRKFKQENTPPMYDLFIEKMDGLSLEDSEKIKVNFYEELGHKLMEIYIPDFPIKAVLSVKFLTMWYYIYKGEKFAV